VLKQILIEIALEKIAAHGLFGREHVLQYLMDLYRRNCRPNTLRSRFASILPLCPLSDLFGEVLSDTSSPVL
jgi:hypothetical protein